MIDDVAWAAMDDQQRGEALKAQLPPTRAAKVRVRYVRVPGKVARITVSRYNRQTRRAEEAPS